MAIEVGSGEYRYRIVENWAKLPDGWSFKEVAAVGDSWRDVPMFAKAGVSLYVGTTPPPGASIVHVPDGDIVMTAREMGISFGD